MRLLLVALFAAACAAEVDYGGTRYRCDDGVTCPEGSECVGGRCLVVPPPRDMVAVPETTFVMGCDPEERADCNEESAPAREVTVSAFELDPTEVSQLDYWRCVADGECAEPSVFTPGDQPELPVTMLDWAAADRYCAWAGKRLPTEAEWEAAARGPDASTYPWGEDTPDCERAQFAGCPPDAVVPVGTPPGDLSAAGMSGMAGNVSEWTADWYDPAYYADGPTVDPPGPPSGAERAMRGGSWNDSADELVAWDREGEAPAEADDDVGVRCAR
jgi:formylglycine-generating enzyme required for sulfatase activity